MSSSYRAPAAAPAASRARISASIASIPPAPRRTAVRRSGADANASSKCASCASSPTRRFRRRWTSPASGSSIPAMIRSSVVLPAPFGPTMPTRSPAVIAASIRSRMTKVPTSRTTPDEAHQRHGQAAPLPARALARRVAAAFRVRSACARAAAARRLVGRQPERALGRELGPAPPRAPGEAGAREDRPTPAAIRRRQPLAPRAVVGGTLADHDAPDRPPAAEARLARPLVDGQVILHRAVTLGRGVVVDGRAAPLDRLGQDGPHRAVEPGLAGRTEGRDPAERMQPRAPERLVGVDVADPGDEGLVEQKRLEPTVPALQARPECPQRERRRERLRPVPGERARLRPRLSSTAPVRGSRGQSPTRPNLRMSRNRISRPSSSVRARWRCRSDGAPDGTTNSCPVILRWTVSAASSDSSTTTSLARRPTADDAPAGDALRERRDGRVGGDHARPVPGRPDDRRADHEPPQVAGDRLHLRELGHRRVTLPCRGRRPSSTPSRRRSSRPR